MKSRNKEMTAKAVLIALLVSTAASPFQSSMASSKSAAKKISVTLNKKTLSLKTGQRFRLKVKKKPAKAKVSFSSSKRSVVSVNKTGLVKAKKPGKASITVTVKYKGKKKKAVCKVRVVSKKKTINKQIQPSAPAANTQQPAPTATVKPVITDPTATPSATPKGTPRATKTPSPTPVEITYKADYTVELGSTLDVKKEVKPSEGVITDYNVSTSNNYVAIIDARGKIKPLHIGKCTLILTSKADDTKKETYKLCVTDEFVAEDGYNFYKEDIAHGEVSDFTYPSQYRESGEGHAKIYFPPDYDPKNKTYNLLFCLHGGGQNEDYWTCGRKTSAGAGCHANNIMDYLYDTKEAEECIVVFPNGNINYDKSKTYPNTEPNPVVQNSWSNCYLFEYEVIYDLLPYMEKNYPVKKGAAHTGVCGLSMGCGEAIELGLKHPDLFQYMGFFSAGPFASTKQTIVTTQEDANRLNSQIKLCFFITGQQDHMMDDSARRFVNQCDLLGLNNMFLEVKGTGHDDRCWDRAFYAICIQIKIISEND